MMRRPGPHKEGDGPVVPRAGEAPRLGMPPRRPPARSPASKRKSKGRIVAGLVLFAWAAGATGFGLWNWFAVGRLVEEQADLRHAYDDKVRALTRRLVGVASHQVLEQDGLSDQMADIIARQVELENRQAALVADGRAPERRGLPGRGGRGGAGGDPRPGATRTARVAQPVGPAPAEPVPTLRLGPPRRHRARARRRKAARGDRRGADARAPPGRPGPRRPDPCASNSPRLQISIGRVETGQVRLVGRVVERHRQGIGTMRSDPRRASACRCRTPRRSDASGRLFVARRRRSPPPIRSRRRSPRSERDFVVLQRWRSVVDAAPSTGPSRATTT